LKPESLLVLSQMRRVLDDGFDRLPADDPFRAALTELRESLLRLDREGDRLQR
jgi:hypothetical protein